MIRTSKITGISYDSDAVLYITDTGQWSFYFANGCDKELLDILYDSSRNIKRPLCMVFRKSKRMHELYDMWLARREELTDGKDKDEVRSQPDTEGEG